MTNLGRSLKHLWINPLYFSGDSRSTSEVPHSPTRSGARRRDLSRWPFLGSGRRVRVVTRNRVRCLSRNRTCIGLLLSVKFRAEVRGCDHSKRNPNSDLSDVKKRQSCRKGQNLVPIFLHPTSLRPFFLPSGDVGRQVVRAGS